MIVQTIEISMSKGRAADILAHVGEEGREIEFIPDVELSADDHTAEIDTVKPDGTFTMTNCSIDENGHIIAPITEQAVAVKGLCHYIIKIYNDDLVIYSACGSLWVDDHLITDDMIESVAEVNGYRFPQEFATLDDIPSADDFIDDNAVETDKTWSSDKISNELGNIESKHYYSTTEQIIGEWYDGKTLYEKVFTGHITNNNLNIDISGLNADNAWIAGGYYDIGVTRLPLCEYIDVRVYTRTHANPGAGYRNIDCSNMVMAVSDVVVILHYTKA